ncbi:unnamed protein product [Angiostrongylus costaricensis]|uniref:DUF7637 domain-containing protein n=1 Tax=Angiostrongylus costaricensis TaxID=334426 RepID=A0A158PF40_ANGCS|nr:unnamed protein product [Angiostrongylus costaricensis]
MELQQSRLKLEVPVVGNTLNSPPSYAQLQHRCLSESLRRFEITFEDVVQTALEEPGCERFVIYNYKVGMVIGRWNGSITIVRFREQLYRGRRGQMLCQIRLQYAAVPALMSSRRARDVVLGLYTALPGNPEETLAQKDIVDRTAQKAYSCDRCSYSYISTETASTTVNTQRYDGLIINEKQSNSVICHDRLSINLGIDQVIFFVFLLSKREVLLFFVHD